jgi:hypothetical protein
MQTHDDPIELDDRVQTIRLRLEAAGVDTSTIVIEVRKSTAVLTGNIPDAGTRLAITEVLFSIPSVDHVVDSLRLGEKDVEPQIYMKQSESLARAFEELFDPSLTWEEYRAAKKRLKRI